MKIYHYNQNTNLFSGEGTADKNPIRENDYIIPAFCTTIQPPVFEINQQAYWNGFNWEIQDIPEPEPPPEPTPTPEPEISPWQNIELQRDGLLRSSDYRILPDANPETKDMWIAYREVLRNITETFSTPESVIWPIPPEL